MKKRRCLVCRRVMSKRPNEPSFDFNKRKSCGRSACYQEMVSNRVKAAAVLTRRSVIKQLPKKKCLVCRKRLAINPDEAPCNFRKRKVCGPECVGGLITKMRAEKRLKALRELPVKSCLWCQRVLKIHAAEDIGSFRKRATCNHRCAAKYTKSLARAAALAMLPDRVCPSCGEVLKIRPDEGLNKFTTRKTCGGKTGCGLAITAKKAIARTQTTIDALPDRGCVSCGQPLKIRAGEFLGNFRQRLTCGDDRCVNAALRRNREQLFDYHGVILPTSTVSELEGISPDALRLRVRSGKIPGVVVIKARRNSAARKKS